MPVPHNDDIPTDDELVSLDRAPETVEQSTPERHAPGTAPVNPLEPKANIRLRRTRPDSTHRLIFGEWYPARRRVRLRDEDGEFSYDLPVLADGSPDVERQRAGWFDEYASRIRERDHRYKQIPQGGRR